MAIYNILVAASITHGGHSVVVSRHVVDDGLDN